MNNNNQKNFFDNFKNPNGSYHIPFWLIIVGFIFNWMLGIGLLFAHLCEDKTSTIPFEDDSYTVKQDAPESGQPVKRTIETAPKSKKKKNPAAVLTGLGIFAAAVGVLDLPDSVQYLVWCIQNNTGLSCSVQDVAENCIWILSGLAMLLGAKRLRTGQQRRNKIAAIVGSSSYIPISEIADALPASRSRTEKYLQQCIDSGIFGEKAYLDMRSDCLVVRGPAPMSKKERESAEAARKAAEEAEGTRDEYSRILKEIRDINDKIPGEEFSANTILGDRTIKNGWKPAPAVIAGGADHEDQPGGGVCQIATTTYMAVLYGDFEVTARRPHSTPSGYPNGLDATINTVTGYIDFKWKNNTESPCYVFTWIDTKNYTVNCSIYGQPFPETFDEIELSSTLVEPLEPGEPEYEVKSSLYSPYWMLKNNAVKGSIYESFKTYKLNGKVVETKSIGNTEYKMHPTRYYVWPGYAGEPLDPQYELKANEDGTLSLANPDSANSTEGAGTGLTQ